MSTDLSWALEVQGLQAGYGAIPVLRGVSLVLGYGEIVTVIGPNGAGKSTLLRTISGLLPVRRGRILLNGVDRTGTPAEDMVRYGLAHIPERRQLFAEMTVEENLRLGAYTRYRRSRQEVERDLERVFELFPILRERRRQQAGTLSGGEQQMVAIGRGLMSAPRVLLLDEPSLGLAPIIARQLFESFSQLRDQGIAILLIEENARQALRVADRGYLLLSGQIILAGQAQDLINDALVQQIYLGAIPELEQGSRAEVGEIG